MSFCPNCGTELEEGARFCGSCGHGRQNAVSAVRQSRTASGGRRLHCPECKSGDISPVVETEISGGTSFNHSFSKRNSVSTMQFNNTHRNYWMCSSCGCKFRNIQNLEEEIRNTEKIVKRGIIGTILWAVFTILTIILGGFGFFHIIYILAIFLFVAAIIYLKNRIAKLNDERAYLKKRCFN